MYICNHDSETDSTKTINNIKQWLTEVKLRMLKYIQGVPKKTLLYNL